MLVYNTEHMQPEVLELISQHREIMHVLDIIDVDLDLDRFREQMLIMASTQYQSQQVALVLLHDTDYCDHDCRTGNSIYNFFRLSAETQLPLEHVILLTNHHGITALVESLAQEICNSTPPLVIETVLWYDFPRPELTVPVARDPGQIFVCVNNRPRNHRIYALCAMSEAGLLDHGSISYHFHT